MDRVFEDEFMDAQSRIISLCVEFAGNRTDKVYAYGSIEESSISFNAFFKIDGQIKTTNNIAADPDAIWDFLDLGEADLEKIRQICIHYEKPVPTELRMIYDCKSGKIDTEYKYESICSAKTGTDSSEIFMKWKKHCEKVIQILRSDYNTQLQYSGIIKKIYDVMLQIISCDNVNELPDIHWNSLARCFADETTDYQSPVLFEIDKIAKLSEGK